VSVDEIISEFPEAVPDPDSRPYWDAAASGQLAIQLCSKCGRGVFPPRAGACWHCGGDVEWTDIPPAGTIYSWVGVDAAIHPWQADLVPYTVVVVQLDAAPDCRIECLYLGNREDLGVGQACEIRFEYPGPSGMPRPVAIRL
jgi:uncharacterized protein